MEFDKLSNPLLSLIAYLLLSLCGKDPRMPVNRLGGVPGHDSFTETLALLLSSSTSLSSSSLLPSTRIKKGCTFQICWFYLFIVLLIFNFIRMRRAFNWGLRLEKKILGRHSGYIVLSMIGFSIIILLLVFSTWILIS